MHRLVKQEVLEFIIPGGTKRLILLCKLLQNFLEFVVMHETEILCINGMKDVQS